MSLTLNKFPILAPGGGPGIAMREWCEAAGGRRLGQYSTLHQLWDDGVHKLYPSLVEVIVILLHRLCNNQVLLVGLGTRHKLNTLICCVSQI